MSKRKTKRTHEFMMRVVFDRAVTPAIAKKEVHKSFVGFSGWTEEDCVAGTLKVTALKSLPSPAQNVEWHSDPYLRIVNLFDMDATAGEFLAEDGEGGHMGAVYRMAREIDRLRALDAKERKE